jgi:hypothetical protein
MHRDVLIWVLFMLAGFSLSRGCRHEYAIRQLQQPAAAKPEFDAREIIVAPK